MSLENITTEQLSWELTDEMLELVVGGSQNPLTDPNPPAEADSPSLYNLDPHSTTQPSRR